MTREATLELLQTNLQSAFPDLLVTREARDFADRSAADCRRGVITLVSVRIGDLRAPTAYVDVAGKLQIALLAEFRLAEKASGLDVERREWALWAQLKAFLKAPGAGLCPLQALSVDFSSQRLTPSGYVFVDLEFAELD